MKTLLKQKLFLTFSLVIGVGTASIFFSNCGQVEFGTNSGKPTTTLEVEPTNGGLSTPTEPTSGTSDPKPPAGGGTPDGCIGDGCGGTVPPPPGHHDGDNCHGGKDRDDHHDGDGCPKDDDGDENHDDGEENDDGHEWNNHGGCKKSCGNNGIKDIIVNIDHIEIRGSGGEVLTISGGDLGETSIISGSLPLSVESDIDVVSIRLVLGNGNNYIIDNSNAKINLKTPSAQNSGLKIPVQGAMSIKKGSYMLNFKINPETQIVKAGKKCLLKPVLKFISLTAI